jgi:deoxycytidylate deaminase
VAADQTELFIALVAAVGTDITMVGEELETELGAYQYETRPLRMSDYLAEMAGQMGMEDFRKFPFDERLWEAMTAGDLLRETWGRGDALALWAISDIVGDRAALADSEIEGPGGEKVAPNLDRHAFVLRSLKTPDELDTLRAVYGERLFVMAAYSPDDRRLASLAEEIRQSRRENDRAKWAHQPEELIERDMHEEFDGGQNVSDTFHRADFFINAWDRDVARVDIERTLRIIFGDPYRTPTRDEHSQFMAAGAARRSAELGRQVGAAIVNDGSIVAVGTNEVPKYGGGSHWEEDGTGNREFEVSQVDTNRTHQQEIASKIAVGLHAYVDRILADGGVDEPGQREQLGAALTAGLPEELLAGGLKDITEFGRGVHAEMSAVLDAAQRGVPIGGCTLHSTTFPCHNCARHLVGAGIDRVVFVEPYPKSKAGDLHEDSIAIGMAEVDDAVDFASFVGVAPRRYLDYFDAGSREKLARQPRKTGHDEVREFVKSHAIPLFPDIEPEEFRPLLPAYRLKELIALKRFEDLQAGQGPLPTDEASGAEGPAERQIGSTRDD